MEPSPTTRITDMPVDVLENILKKTKNQDEQHFIRALRSTMPKTRGRTKKNLPQPPLDILLNTYIDQRYNIKITYQPQKGRMPKHYDFECEVPISATQKQKLTGELKVDYNFRGEKLNLEILFDPVTILHTHYEHLSIKIDLMGYWKGKVVFLVRGTTEGVLYHGCNLHLFENILRVLYFTILQKSWMEYTENGKQKLIVNASSYIQAYLEEDIQPTAILDFTEYFPYYIKNTITIDASELPWFDDYGNILPIQSIQYMKDHNYLANVSTGYKTGIRRVQNIRRVKIHALNFIYKDNQLVITVYYYTTPTDIKMDIRRFTPTTLNLIAQIVHYNLWSQHYRNDGPRYVQDHLKNVLFELHPCFENEKRALIGKLILE